MSAMSDAAAISQKAIPRKTFGQKSDEHGAL